MHTSYLYIPVGLLQYSISTVYQMSVHVPLADPRKDPDKLNLEVAVVGVFADGTFLTPHKRRISSDQPVLVASCSRCTQYGRVE